MNRDTADQLLHFQPAGSSFETDRKRFLGDNEYGTWAAPAQPAAAELSNYEALRGDNIAALLHPLGALQPGETRGLITQLGQAASLEAAAALIAKYRQPAGSGCGLAAALHDILGQTTWPRCR